MIGLWAVVLAVRCSAAAPAPPPALEWLPQGAVSVLRVAQPGALLDLAESVKLLEAVKGLEQVLAPLTGPLKTDWKSALRRMAGGGITYAVYPGDTSVVIVDASDAEAFDPLQQMARPLPAPPAKAFYVEFPAVAAWSFDGKQFFARTASRLVMTNRGEALKMLFDPRPAGTGSLALWAPYMQALRAAGDGAVGTYFLNLALLKQAPQVRKALGEAGSPLEILLNGAVRESLNDANWVGAALGIEGRSLVLRAASDGQPAAKGAGAFSTPEGAAVLPNLKVPGELAGVSLWALIARKSVLASANAVAPAVMTAGAVARLGCVFAGCCRGLLGLPLFHAWPLYDIAALLVALMLGVQVEKRRAGGALLAFLIVYGVLRFFLEFARDVPASALGLTAGQWFAAVQATAGVALLVAGRAKSAAIQDSEV